MLEQYFDKEELIRKAEAALLVVPRHITDIKAPHSEGGKNDYYSNGDYWWPNPDTPNGLPYVRRDGESNPDNFKAHRLILRDMKASVGSLSTAYRLTNDEKYAKKAIEILKEFFIDEETKMAPHLLYGQAIPGVCSGRCIGIIDTTHLMDIPFCIHTLKDSIFMLKEIYEELKKWFAQYKHWLLTHPYGIEEGETINNHSVGYFAQLAAFAHLTQDREVIDLCIKTYKEVLLPNQMSIDGSFEEELARTKPYSYSYFVLENMVALCQVIGKYDETIWRFETNEGKSIKKGIDFFVPYIEDINKWPYSKDIQYFEDWPIAMSMLLLAGLALGEERYLSLYKKLDNESPNLEINRSKVVKYPLLWI